MSGRYFSDQFYDTFWRYKWKPTFRRFGIFAHFDNPELLKSEKLWVSLINRQWKWAKIGLRLIDFMFLRLEHFRADPDISPGHPARDFNYFLRKLITTLDIEKSNHLYI